MKILDVAAKDLVRSFRSSFLLGMMFVVPLLLTALIYFAFGNLVHAQGRTISIPATRALVVNLDQADPQIGVEVGKQLLQFLQNEELSSILSTTKVSSEAEARAAVDRRLADVAIIIPQGLSAAVSQPDGYASVVLYADPTQTITPAIIEMLISDFLDGFSGAKIAVDVTSRQMSSRGSVLDDAKAQAVAQQYATWVQSNGHSHGENGADSVVVTRTPQQDPRPTNPINAFLGPVMAGMMVFFVFFTGCAAAQSILVEDEEGTLARLFATPTSRATVLGGKFVAVFATLIVQIVVLLIASSLVFGIRWGEMFNLVILTFGLAVCASGFGVLLISLIKTTRQAGPVSAAVVVVTGILSGLMPVGDPSQPSPLETVGLAFPQGWALRGLKSSLSSAGPSETLLPLIILLASGVIFLVIGSLIFRRRFD